MRKMLSMVLLFVAACVGPSYSAPNRDVRVVATNHNWNEVIVYDVSSVGMRARIGTVESGRTETLRLPKRFDNDYSLQLVEFAGSDTETFSHILLPPDVTLLLDIENQLAASGLLVESNR